MSVDFVSEEESEFLPTKCPLCGQDLVWVGVDLKCENLNCPNIELSDLQQWCESIGETDGLQWTLMKQYLDFYGVTSIDNLYVKQEGILYDLNSRKLSITEIKVKEFFEKLFLLPVPIEKALIGLNIPRLGDKTAIQLANNIDAVINYYRYCNSNMDKDLDKTEQVYNELIDVVKSATTVSLFENSKKFLNLKYLNFCTVNNRVKYNSTITNTEKRYIAVTGALESMKRKDFEKYIANYGYELTSNLKKCKYLVTNNVSGSSKYKDAIANNIPIISETEFLESLKNL